MQPPKKMYWSVIVKFLAEDERPFHAKFITKYSVLTLKSVQTLTYI
jgi:hypothetical protein